MKAIYDHPDSLNIWVNVLNEQFGEKPPISGMNTWVECLLGELHLYFEAQTPSPKKYREWLSMNISDAHFIPYILDAAGRDSR